MKYIYLGILGFIFDTNFVFADTSPQADLVVGVFCSADDKIPEEFKDQTRELGKELAKNNWGLVTGGSKTGLMKEVVDGYISATDRPKLLGILPTVMKDLKVHHPSISELIWADTMHQRLANFHEKCHAVVVLPGGFGTLHKLMDFLVHNQFGIIKKKIILLNLDDYWTPLLEQFKLMVKNNALQQKHLDHLVIVNDIEGCVKAIKSDVGADLIQGFEDRFWEKNKQ